MNDENRARLIRRLIVVLVFGGAITAGYFIDLPVWVVSRKRQEQADKKTEEGIREALKAEHRLTILNAMVDGSPDSKKLKEVIERLCEEKYGEAVQQEQLDVERLEGLADEHAIDLGGFAGQLDFYAGGQKLGTLKGMSDPLVVEQTIDRHLDELIKRFGPNWLPPFVGEAQARSAPGATSKPALPTVVPGMQKVGGPEVPGMKRAKPSGSRTEVEPTDGAN